MKSGSEKNKNIKNSLEYFLMDYKLFIAAGLLVVILAVYFVAVACTSKETLLSVMLIDCQAQTDGEEMADFYMETAGLDKKEYQVQIQSDLMFQGTDSGDYTMTSLSKFMTDIGSERLDVCGMLLDDFEKYDKAGSWMDLRECLTKEQSETLKSHFLETEDGRVIGLLTDALPQMKADGCYCDEEKGVIGIAYNTPHREEAIRYLLYLAGEMEQEDE